MSESVNRREFMKTMSLFGASIIVDNHSPAMRFLSANGHGDISNDFFTVSFDPGTGKLNVSRSDGTLFLSGGTVRVNTTDGTPSLASSHYKHRVDASSFRDKLGDGKRLVISSLDDERQIDLETRVSIYNHLKSVIIEATCKNVSSREIVIRSIEPMRLVREEGGMIHAPGVSHCLTNGEMYYDAGVVHEFARSHQGPSTGNVKGIRLTNRSISPVTETIHSWWNTGLFSGYGKEGVVLGYLDNTLCLGNILTARTSPDMLSFVAESVYAPELVLRPGDSVSSNRVMLLIGDDPYKALEEYARTVGVVNSARTRSIVNGWCSWFYTLAQVSEDEVLRNAEFASKHLKHFGLEYIQIDEGYQRWHGDWEGNERFPHGMKWLSERIRGYGFKPGLWISPYVISEPTEVFRKHSDWLVHDASGNLQRIGNWEEGAAPPPDENPRRYCLDITHPGAADWMRTLFDTIAHRWGYEMIKIDFMAWSILAAKRYHDPAMSSAQVYRRGLEIMRSAAGDACHILECGPGAITVGLIDSMRIEADINYGYAEAAWKTYFADPACSMAAAAKRFYFHKRTWVNDADHICMQLLTNGQSEAAASVIALSGGNMISGDRLTELDPVKLEILRKITPSAGEAAFPVDLFDSGMPSVLAVKIEKPFGEWTVAGMFNPDLSKSVERSITLERLHLDPGKRYLAFDFWRKRFFGEVSRELRATIQPGSATLLSLHEQTGRPQVLSTDRHVLQGAVELEDVHWEEDSRTLSGDSTGPAGTSHNVFVYVPGEHPWIWGGYVLYRDYDSYSLKLVEENIIQVHVSFGDRGHVHWQIAVGEFFR